MRLKPGPGIELELPLMGGLLKLYLQGHLSELYGRFNVVPAERAGGLALYLLFMRRRHVV